MFNKLLIANRGEIDCRIIKTCDELGISTVAVYSDADSRSLHLKMADESINIGPAPSSESYLLSDNIISACKKTGAAAPLVGVALPRGGALPLRRPCRVVDVVLAAGARLDLLLPSVRQRRGFHGYPARGLRSGSPPLPGSRAPAPAAAPRLYTSTSRTPSQRWSRTRWRSALPGRRSSPSRR